MINLAGRDILYAWKKFLLTGAGLGLLIGVTLSMAGIYRGMVDDARALLDNRLAPSIDDVAALAPPVLRHRIALNFRAEAEGITTDTAIAELIKVVK